MIVLHLILLLFLSFSTSVQQSRGFNVDSLPDSTGLHNVEEKYENPLYKRHLGHALNTRFNAWSNVKRHLGAALKFKAPPNFIHRLNRMGYYSYRPLKNNWNSVLDSHYKTYRYAPNMKRYRRDVAPDDLNSELNIDTKGSNAKDKSFNSNLELGKVQTLRKGDQSSETSESKKNVASATKLLLNKQNDFLDPNDHKRNIGSAIKWRQNYEDSDKRNIGSAMKWRQKYDNSDKRNIGSAMKWRQKYDDSDKRNIGSAIKWRQTYDNSDKRNIGSAMKWRQKYDDSDKRNMGSAMKWRQKYDDSDKINIGSAMKWRQKYDDSDKRNIGSAMKWRQKYDDSDKRNIGSAIKWRQASPKSDPFNKRKIGSAIKWPQFITDDSDLDKRHIGSAMKWRKINTRAEHIDKRNAAMNGGNGSSKRHIEAAMKWRQGLNDQNTGKRHLGAALKWRKIYDDQNDMDFKKRNMFGQERDFDALDINSGTKPKERHLGKSMADTENKDKRHIGATRGRWLHSYKPLAKSQLQYLYDDNDSNEAINIPHLYNIPDKKHIGAAMAWRMPNDEQIKRFPSRMSFGKLDRHGNQANIKGLRQEYEDKDKSSES